MRAIIKIGALFAFLGPFIGSVVFLAVGSIFSRGGYSTTDSILSQCFAVVMMCLWAYPFSLVLGFVPAACAGFAYGVILKRRTTANLHPLKRLPAGGALGAIMSWVFGMLFVQLVDGQSRNAESVLIIWGLPGFVGGAASALLVRDRLYAKLLQGARPGASP